MTYLLSARILTGFIAVVLAVVMVGGLWMKSGLGTVPLLVVSALLVYISIVIACMLGERGKRGQAPAALNFAHELPLSSPCLSPFLRNWS